MPENENVEGGDAGAYFLEYESDSKRGGNVFMTLQDPTCTVMTRGQRNKKLYLGASPNMSTSKVKELIHVDSTKTIEPKKINLE